MVIQLLLVKKTTFEQTLNILRSILDIKYMPMKSISIFALLIYWSIILLAPVISKEHKGYKGQSKITLNK